MGKSTAIVRAISLLVLAGLFSSLSLIKSPSAKAQNGLEVGIFLPDAAQNFSSFTAYEKNLGLTFDSAEWYMSFNDSFDPEIANRFHNHGDIVQLAWEPNVSDTTFLHSDITSGKWDGYLVASAQSMKNTGYPIRISLAPEMNSSWTAWGAERMGNSNETYTAMFRYIVSLFRAQGATNVQWVWAPNTHYWGERYSYAQLYPGDQYVDFLGLDGYNWGTNYPGGTWISFYNTYARSYRDMVSLSNRRILIMEVGSSEYGGNKAQWITDMFYELRTDFPRIQGVSWFNENKGVDWRIETSVASRQAFIDGVNGVIPVRPTPVAAVSLPANTANPTQPPPKMPTTTATIPNDLVPQSTPAAGAAPVPTVKPVDSTPSSVLMPPVRKTLFVWPIQSNLKLQSLPSVLSSPTVYWGNLALALVLASWAVVLILLYLVKKPSI